jgi:hypothetical protein
MKVKQVRQFFSERGTPLAPQALFADLRLGLFLDRDRLVLASW